MKKVRTCYISAADRKVISNLAGGNFSAGIEVCAKDFACFSKGSPHYCKSVARIIRYFQLCDAVPVSKAFSDCIADGHHLQGFLITLSTMLNDDEIALNVNAEIVKGNSWIEP